MALKISEFNTKHLATAVELLNEEYKTSYEFIPFDEERVLSQIQQRRLKTLVAEENGEVTGLIGTHTHVEERLEEHISWLAARKGHRQRAVENTLVKKIEKDAKGAVIVMIDDQSPKIKDWIERGYALCPGYQRMSATLDGLRQVPKLAEGVGLRSLRSGEEEKFIMVINVGFGWARLEPGVLEAWKSQNPLFNEEWIHVADAGDRFVSAVVAKPDTEYVRYLNLRRGYLGPAATLPEYRNKHLGSALTVRAMNLLFEKGMDSVRVGTHEQNTSSIALLRSLGFQVDIVRKILRKDPKMP